MNSITDVDECASRPCQNGGTCYDELKKYRCECDERYTGINCERGKYILHSFTFKVLQTKGSYNNVKCQAGLACINAVFIECSSIWFGLKICLFIINVRYEDEFICII